MPAWNFATMWEIVADVLPDAPAVIQGDRVVTWSEFDHRADGVAATLLERGAGPQDKVAQYLYNCPEYLESMFAAFKAGLVPVNTNYRYADDELVYLWDNADAVCVVFHGAFGDRVDAIRDRLPKVATWLWVDDGTGPCPEWAIAYAEAAARPTGRVVAPWGRGDDDLLLMYTGGTTGMPKGVMWRQDYAHPRRGVVRQPAVGRRGRLRRHARPARDGSARWGPAARAPAHARHRAVHDLHRARAAAARWSCSPSRTFDVEELLDTIEQRRVELADHRGRRLRQAHPAGPRRRARALGPLRPGSWSPRPA